MVSYSMGLCHYGLGQIETALGHANEAVTLGPNFEDARALRIKIEAGIELQSKIETSK